MVVPSKEFFEEYDEKQRQRYTKAKHDFDVLLANGKHCPDWRAECFEVVKSKADSVGFPCGNTDGLPFAGRTCSIL